MTKKSYVAPNNYIPPAVKRAKDIALYKSPKSTAELLEERQTILDIKGKRYYVTVSELKKQAVQTLIENVDHSQVLDYL